MIQNEGPYEPGNLVRIAPEMTHTWEAAYKTYPADIPPEALQDDEIIYLKTGNLCLFLGYDEDLCDGHPMARGTYCCVLYEDQRLWVATTALW